jgi:H+/Cl- antiporter ClcA
MAHVDALPQLSLMGVLCGLLSGAVIIAFRWIVEVGAPLLTPMEHSDAFESLGPHWRLAIAVAGGLVVGWLFQLVQSGTRQVGVVHVIERLNYHQGNLPLRNAVLQFIGAAVSIVCGHSVGREGPNIHLGATAGSLLGRKLGLPNNSVRTLVGCGVAAAIAAGFNTPLAGVVFAMEVVLMEYTIVGFVPIMLAAVSATALTRLVFGEHIIFYVSVHEWSTINEFLYALFLGCAIGILAALFIRLTLYITEATQAIAIWVRLTIAGAVVGLIAIPVPEVMGIGYDTVSAALLGEIALFTLAIIVAAKLFATAACIGLGSPGGLIAPSLFIGASTGGAVGSLIVVLFNDQLSSGTYAMIGMGAMMAATLQAPMAALLALLELTANPNLIMPSMTAVISAVLVTRVVFGCPSIYQLMLQNRGLDIHSDPLAQSLQRIGIVRAMDKSFVHGSRLASRKAAELMLKNSPAWVLVSDQDGPTALLPAADLALFLEDHAEQEEIDLLEIPAKRRDLSHADVLASLKDALELLNESGKGALYVTGTRGRGSDLVYGVLTRDEIERSYRLS